MNRDRCQKQEEMKRQRIENFQGTEITLYDITMFSYTFQKPWNVQSKWKWKVLAAQSCPPFWDPVDCSPAVSSVDGILQATTLEWIAISFSRVSSQPGFEPVSPALQVDSLPSEPSGNELLT